MESEQWLGSLIHANEGLVEALMAYEVLDKDLEDDSDSDAQSDEINEWDSDEAESKAKGKGGGVQPGFAGLTLGPKTAAPEVMVNGRARGDDSESEDDDDEEEQEGDEDNPFGDVNAVHTPKEERPGMTW